MKRCAAALLFLLAAPCLAQELEPADPPAEEARSPLIAGVWCAVKESAPPETEEGEEEVQRPDEIGCDAGLAIALYRWRFVSPVVGIGTRSIVAGLAWVPYRPRSGPLIAIAIGVALPYDGEGIYTRGAALALGATLSFASRKEP